MLNDHASGAVSVIEGGKDAVRLLVSLQDGQAPSDALLGALRMVQALGDERRTVGFCRSLQKALERGPSAIR